MSVVRELTPFERAFFLLLYASKAGEKIIPIKGETFLQKEMFLILQAIPKLATDADFEAYRYGSFSETVEAIEDVYMNSLYLEKKENTIHLTERGRKLASEVWNYFGEKDRSTAQDIREHYDVLTEDELLLFMYVTYPETAANSTVKTRILAKRRPLAVNIYKKGRASLEKAAELADMEIRDFLNEVQSN